jgi:hypothetical protein
MDCRVVRSKSGLMCAQLKKAPLRLPNIFDRVRLGTRPWSQTLVRIRTGSTVKIIILPSRDQRTRGGKQSVAVLGTPLRTRRRPGDGLIAAVSRSHLDAGTDAFVARLPNATRLVCGSALKFCRTAEGAADLYPRLTPTSE